MTLETVDLARRKLIKRAGVLVATLLFGPQSIVKGLEFHSEGDRLLRQNFLRWLEDPAKLHRLGEFYLDSQSDEKKIDDLFDAISEEGGLTLEQLASMKPKGFGLFLLNQIKNDFTIGRTVVLEAVGFVRNRSQIVRDFKPIIS